MKVRLSDLCQTVKKKAKGDELTKETFPLLKKAPINFIGNIEGRDVMEGTADVITCDGFVGNVILKTVEGMGHVVSTKVKNIFMKTCLQSSVQYL